MEFENFENEDDIRSVTNNYINQTIQNFIFSIKLSFNLLDINYCNNNISNQIQIEDLEITHNNFIGYTKEAFFINFSIIVENHFRQIAMHYENETKKINVIPIRQTFENLFNINKLLKFNNLLNENEFKTYYFFLSLRNTMHNIGVHTREDSSIEFNTSNSIFSFETFSLSLKKNDFNKISFSQLIILIEQVYRLVNKINSKIENSEFIKHRLVDAGFNE
ncbi:hypothetical protein ACTS90_18185 [Empedobacter falsenii]